LRADDAYDDDLIMFTFFSLRDSKKRIASSEILKVGASLLEEGDSEMNWMGWSM
jgi:hypothetical protein